MARSFKSIAAFCQHMEGVARTLPRAEHRALDKASAFLLEKVREIPGEYQSGWPRLAEATQKRRAAAGFTPDDPLLVSGAQRDSYQRKVVDHRRAAVGSDKDTALWSELGTSREPPRPVLLTAATRHEGEVRKIIDTTVVAHLAGRQTV